MNTDAEIISGASIGGIQLGGDAVSELLKIYDEGRKVNEIDHENISQYEIEGGIITISADKKSQKIKQIWCKKPYSGKYLGILSPGMRIAEIMECTSKQRIVCGFLCINDDLTAGFNIPNQYEETDYVKDLPDNLILDEIHIMEKGWCGLRK